MKTYQIETLHIWMFARWFKTVMWLSLVVNCFQVNFILGSVGSNFVKASGSSGSLSTCAVVDSSVVSVLTRSVLQCALECSTETECVGFNSRPGSRTCELFTRTPIQFLTSNGCNFYGVTLSVLWFNKKKD